MKNPKTPIRKNVIKSRWPWVWWWLFRYNTKDISMKKLFISWTSLKLKIPIPRDTVNSMTSHTLGENICKRHIW